MLLTAKEIAILFSDNCSFMFLTSTKGLPDNFLSTLNLPVVCQHEQNSNCSFRTFRNKMTAGRKLQIYEAA